MSIPSRIGRYVVRRRIGAGGFATVWLAYDEQLDSPVTIKVLADNWTEDHHVLTRFLEEGRYLRRETFSGTCARSFYVGDAVKKEDIHAKFEDGILHVTLPASQQQKALPVNPNLIEIE